MHDHPTSCMHGCSPNKQAFRQVQHIVASLLVCFQVMRRYHIQNRDDYKKYNKIVGMVTKLTNVLKQLDPKDAVRIELTDQLLEK